MPKKKVNGSFDEKAVKNVLKMVKEKDIKIIDLKFNDLPGLWQHFSIPATELTEIDDPVTSIWVEGIGFDGSSIRVCRVIRVIFVDGFLTTLYHPPSPLSDIPGGGLHFNNLTHAPHPSSFRKLCPP
jgi:hypothetical protein